MAKRTEQSRLVRDGDMRVRLHSAPGPDHVLTVTAVDDPKAGRFLVIDIDFTATGPRDPYEDISIRAIVVGASACDLAQWLSQLFPTTAAQGKLL